MVDQKFKDITLDMIKFIEASPTASHSVAESIRRLEAVGFRHLDEKDKWDVKPCDWVYFTRNGSSLIAVRVGTASYASAGFRIVGAHTDFPGLRLKPNGVYSKNGYLQLGVEIYGGPIIHSWLDRDLGIAGRLVVEDGGESDVVLFDVKRPVCRIPDLAPHIRVNKTEEIKFNKQDHMPPVIGLGDEKSLEEEPVKKLTAKTAGVDPAKVSSYSIEIYDVQPGTLGGMNEEFVFSRSLDNLSSCHAAIKALLKAPDNVPFSQVVALFDNEEVGSQTMQGARSGFLDTVLERLCMGTENSREDYFRALANSIFISCDGAHALNPNYPEAHEPRHYLYLNGGPVMKVNAMQNYATQIEAKEHLEKCAKRAEVPLQTFVARTDVGTGSTIGPMTASRLGIRAVDIGNPMVSMHSIREMGGTEDQLHMVNLLIQHFS
ncbi:MAG: M18 family aminopeptidase [bacterium]|nr:M18 family aminopeptidase [bacterium]